MSVDTYLKGKNTSRYQVVQQDGLQILLSFRLVQWAKGVDLRLNRFLFFKWFAVDVEPMRAHVHGPT